MSQSSVRSISLGLATLVSLCVGPAGAQVGATTSSGFAGRVAPDPTRVAAANPLPGMWVPYPPGWAAPPASTRPMARSAGVGQPFAASMANSSLAPPPGRFPGRTYLPEMTPRVAVPPVFMGGGSLPPSVDSLPPNANPGNYYFANYGYSPYYYAPTQPSYAAYAQPGSNVGQPGTPVYQVRYNDLPGAPVLSQGNAGNPRFATPATFGYPTFTNDRAFFGQGLNVYNTPGQISYGQSTQATLTPPGYFGNILPTTPP